MVKIKEVKQPRAGKDGKTYWHKLGVKFVYDDGKESIKLDSLPLPNERGEVWMNLFDLDFYQKDNPFDKPEDTANDTDPEDKPDEIPF